MRWLTAFVASMSLGNNAFAPQPGFDSGRTRLGIDYGPRYIGLATCNLLGVVSPLATISNTRNLSEVSLYVLAAAANIGASEIIVGLPLDSNGVMSHKVRNFNGNLCLNFSKVLSYYIAQQPNRRLSAYLFDERYTTKEAKLRLKTTSQKASVDSMSAACLLERYIEDKGEGALPAEAASEATLEELSAFDYNIVRRHVRMLHRPKQLNTTKQRLPPDNSTTTLCDNQSSEAVHIPHDEDTSEMVELRRIRSARRKLGTLRRPHILRTEPP